MSEDAIRKLLTAIREDCAPSTWSQAVELARSHSVVGEASENDEIRLRVSTGAGLVCPTVTLWLEDEDWWCDCDSGDERACVHVAAAVIALRQARKEGKLLPEARRPKGKLGYRFRRTPTGLVFERVVVLEKREETLQGTLSAVALGRVAGPSFLADLQDLNVERALGSRLSGLFLRHELAPLLEALAGCEDIRLDGIPVKIGLPESPVHVLVEDCAAGYRLTAIQDPAITEVFENGVVLCGDTLRALGEPGLSAGELEDLRKGRILPAQQVSSLLTDLLPDLRKRVPVHIESKHLPHVNSDILPRISIESTCDGDELVLLATLVYGSPPIARVDGDHLTHLRGPVPVRRPEMERRLLRSLESDFGLHVGQRLRFRGEQGLAVADRIREATRDVSVVGNGHGSFFRASELMEDLRIDGDDFGLTFRTKEGGRADPASVLRAWNAGESLVPLLDGGLAPLPNDFLERHGNVLADLMAARSAAEGRLPPSALPDLAKLCDSLGVAGPPGFERLRSLVEHFDGIPEAPLPSDLRAELRTYQKRGIDWLVFLRSAGLGALLADDMGLGKTLQALCAIQGRTLVVAPTSVIHNWAAEIQRFRPALTWNLFHGPRRSLDSSVDVTLTTYALLRIDAEKIGAVDWGTLVLDEAQAIKNPESQVAQAAYGLRAGFRIAMTGTPVENRLDELWSQFHAINRGLLGDRQDFRDRVVRPLLEGVPGVSGRLRERIRPFLLRRRKAEVAPELPPRSDVVLRCELDEGERVLYESLRGATVPSVVEKLRSGGNVMEALEALLRLRQAACHAALVPGQVAESSSKVALLLEMLEAMGHGEHKALVFSQWTSLLDRVEPHLESLGLAYVRLDGSTRDREGVVRAFQDPGGPSVMLVSLRAGGTGLNLTAADHVFLLDPWWNPAVEDQAADRTHRIGQERPVMVYKLVARDTVEERILELQERKRAIAAAALDGGEGGMGLTREDLLALLS